MVYIQLKHIDKNNIFIYKDRIKINNLNDTLNEIFNIIDLKFIKDVSKNYNLNLINIIKSNDNILIKIKDIQYNINYEIKIYSITKKQYVKISNILYKVLNNV